MAGADSKAVQPGHAFVPGGVRLVAVAAAACAGALVIAPFGLAAVREAPVIVSMSVSGARPLPAAGAPVIVSVRVANANSCTFLRQRSAFSSLYPLKTVSCASGRASVVVPAISNGSRTPVQLSFEVRAAGSRSVARRVVKVAESAAAQPPPPPAVSNAAPPPSPPPYAISGNWSGYVLPSPASTLTDATGTFTVPTLDCTVTPDAGMAAWVGIGGDDFAVNGPSGSLLQTGVISNCDGGVQDNQACWELWPSDPNQEFSFDNFPVTAGDTITASVYQDASGTWWTQVDDTTTGTSGWLKVGGNWGVGTDASAVYYTQGSAALLAYAGGYTADWIVEDYTEPGGQSLAPLADFGAVTFTDLTTSNTTWYLTPQDGLALDDGNGNLLATPSPPADDGSFTVTYQG
jgi:hypothetical protein